MKRRRLFTSLSLLAVFMLLTGPLLAHPQAKAYAQDCMECTPGDPIDPPGGGGDPEPPDDDPPGNPDPPDPPGAPNPPDDDPPLDPPGDPDPDPTPCVECFDPPAFGGSFSLIPPYPFTLGQDPDDLGVSLTGVHMRGGYRHCPDEGAARITVIRVLSVRLADTSIAWIENELSRKYPGAHVKGSYPFVPSFEYSGIGSSSASLWLHFDPLDPGYYEILIEVTQEDGQTARRTVVVPVYLMESTIIK